MRRTYWILAIGLLLMPMLAKAQSAFDGTWKVDMNKVDFPKKPDVFLLQGDTYECKSCVPMIKVKADGNDQKITGQPYFDTMAVKVVGNNEMEETTKKNGKVVGTTKRTVSSDGDKMTADFSYVSDNGTTVNGKQLYARVGEKPAAGANMVSGSWRTTDIESLSSDAITWTYKVTGDELSMTSPTGGSYTAKLDGSDAPYKGDPGITSVSVKKMGDNTIQETDKRNGKVIGVMTATLNGNTMSCTYDDKLQGSSMKYTATKQ